MNTIHINDLESDKSAKQKKNIITKEECTTIISNKINKLDILLQKKIITKKDYDYTKARIYDFTA